MPIAASDKIRSQQERLNASMQAVLETIRQPLLENCARITEVQREMEHGLQDLLREGLEREDLLATLASVRSQAERELELFGMALAIFESDPVAVPTIESQLRVTQGFLAWVRGLEARVAAPLPPFDETRLAPAPVGTTAEGYLSVSEARTRTAKKP